MATHLRTNRREGGLLPHHLLKKIEGLIGSVGTKPLTKLLTHKTELALVNLAVCLDYQRGQHQKRSVKVTLGRGYGRAAGVF